MHHFDTTSFHDRNGERHMLAMRIRALADVLRDRYMTRSVTPSGDFEIAEGDLRLEELAEKARWRPFAAGVDRWGRPDEWVWFRQTVTVPAEYAGKDIWYFLYPYNEREVWYWGQPQIQLFVNGQCVCGFDNCHRSCLLVKNAKGGETLELALKAYSDLKYYRDTMTLIGELCVLRPDVYELYQSIAVPMKAASLMSADSDGRVKILKELNRVMTILQLDADPEGPEFSASVREAAAWLGEHLYGSFASGEEPVLWAVGHSHIDIAWQWTYHVSRNKAARTFATQLRLMEQNPEYLFLSSQPQLYDFIKEDEPAMFEEIRERVAEGRWEAEGGLWVECDTNLTGGESLIRQFLFGKRFFRKEFGVENRICWLPDVFGYSAALPQIMKKSGIQYFYTTKIGWNEYNKFPYDTFLWRGIDGSEVLSHFGCAKEYVETESDWMTTYNPDLEPHFVLGTWQRYQQKDLNRDLLYDFGYGDGGGGPTQEMIDYGRRFAAGVPGCPKVKFAKAGDFFEKLEKDVSNDPHLPVWDGEMYLEYHRGTYTSQAYNKRANRKSEILYHDAENASAAAMVLLDRAYPQEELNANWKLILLNQFHDVLPGSSITKVYEDSRRHYEQVQQAGNVALDQALTALAAAIAPEGAGCGEASEAGFSDASEAGCGAPSVTVFNTLSWDRPALVTVDIPASGEAAPGAFPAALSEDGLALPLQKTWDGKRIFLAPAIPSKGWQRFALLPLPSGEELPAMTVTASGIETDCLSVRFDEQMRVISLVNKQTGRDILPAGGRAARLVAYEDRPPRDDAWNVQEYRYEKATEIDDVQSVEVLESGPVRALIRVKRRFRSSTITEDISVTAHSPLLRFDFDVDWHEDHFFVIAENDVDVNTTHATYDIPFAYLERSNITNTLWDFGHFEASGHKYADLSDNGQGLAVLNDCKYGYSARKKALGLSLIKCAQYPDPEADQGRHVFAFALYAHEGGPREGRVRQLSAEFNYPVHTVVSGHSAAAPSEAATAGAALAAATVTPNTACAVAPAAALPASFSLFRLDAPNVVLETVKKAEDTDALILRLYEADNRACTVTLRSPLCFTRACSCNLMEEPEEALELNGAAEDMTASTCADGETKPAGTALTLSFKPFEIRTVRLEKA